LVYNIFPIKFGFYLSENVVVDPLKRTLKFLVSFIPYKIRKLKVARTRNWF